MPSVGYAHLLQQLPLTAFASERPARVASVTRVTATADAILVPAHVAPTHDEPLEHVLFALKHEGIQLQILAQALRNIPGAVIRDAIRRIPTGSYVRVAGCLWEAFNRRTLDDLPVIAGPTIKLFDSRRYLTGPARRDPRWRVSFNGFGSLDYCATVDARR